MAAIGAATLTPTMGSPPDRSLACFICGGLGTADAVLNLILFAPLGAGLALAHARLRRALVVGALVSAFVEAAQLGMVPGRDPSFGDWLFNLAGTGAGYGLVRVAGLLATLDDRVASRLSMAALLDVGLAMALTGWLLQPSLPRLPYWAHWTPRLGHLEWYRGSVEHATIGGHQMPQGLVNDPGRTRDALLRGEPLEVRFTAGPTVPGLASLFNLSDDELREVVLLGPDRNDLVYRFRTRSAAWGLDHPDLRLAAVGALAAGDTATARVWQPEPGRWCLTLGRAQACDLGFTVGAGWSLLLYAEGLSASLREWTSAGWVALIVLPVGYLLRRRWESGAAAAGVGLAAALLPGVVALRPTTRGEWCGIAVGLLLGMLMARLARRWSGPAPIHGRP